MQIWEAVLLGIIQGITEWFPVSSSGHLAITQNAMGVAPPLLFDALLHVGTLAAVWIYMKKDVRKMINGLLYIIVDVLKRRPVMENIRNDPYRRVGAMILIASVPIMIGGLVFAPTLEGAFGSMTFVGAALIISGIILVPTHRPENNGEMYDMTLKRSIIIGLAQVAALFPGISRSGVTISAGIFRGMKRGEAARFSFILAMPAISGAGTLQTARHFVEGGSVDAPMIVGTVVAFFTGLLALHFLLKLIQKKGLRVFAPYCIAVGSIVLLWGLGVF